MVNINVLHVRYSNIRYYRESCDHERTNEIARIKFFYKNIQLSLLFKVDILWTEGVVRGQYTLFGPYHNTLILNQKTLV